MQERDVVLRVNAQAGGPPGTWTRPPQSGDSASTDPGAMITNKLGEEEELVSPTTTCYHSMSDVERLLQEEEEGDEGDKEQREQAGVAEATRTRGPDMTGRGGLHAAPENRENQRREERSSSSKSSSSGSSSSEELPSASEEEGSEDKKKEAQDIAEKIRRLYYITFSQMELILATLYVSEVDLPLDTRWRTLANRVRRLLKDEEKETEMGKLFQNYFYKKRDQVKQSALREALMLRDDYESWDFELLGLRALREIAKDSSTMQQRSAAFVADIWDRPDLRSTTTGSTREIVRPSKELQQLMKEIGAGGEQLRVELRAASATLDEKLQAGKLLERHRLYHYWKTLVEEKLDRFRNYYRTAIKLKPMTRKEYIYALQTKVAAKQLEKLLVGTLLTVLEQALPFRALARSKWREVTEARQLGKDSIRHYWEEVPNLLYKFNYDITSNPKEHPWKEEELQKEPSVQHLKRLKRPLMTTFLKRRLQLVEENLEATREATPYLTNHAAWQPVNLTPAERIPIPERGEQFERREVEKEFDGRVVHWALRTVYNLKEGEAPEPQHYLRCLPAGVWKGDRGKSEGPVPEDMSFGWDDTKAGVQEEEQATEAQEDQGRPRGVGAAGGPVQQPTPTSKGSKEKEVAAEPRQGGGSATPAKATGEAGPSRSKVKGTGATSSTAPAEPTEQQATESTPALKSLMLELSGMKMEELEGMEKSTQEEINRLSTENTELQEEINTLQTTLASKQEKQKELQGKEKARATCLREIKAEIQKRLQQKADQLKREEKLKREEQQKREEEEVEAKREALARRRAELLASVAAINAEEEQLEASRKSRRPSSTAEGEEEEEEKRKKARREQSTEEKGGEEKGEGEAKRGAATGRGN